MKLKDQLSSFQAMYNTFKNNQLQKDWAFAIETKYSVACMDKMLRDLKPCLNKSTTRASIKPIQDFLAQRWTRIQSTDLAYTQAPNDKFNVLCIALAKAIAPIANINANQLLMPTLTKTVSSVTGNSLDTLNIRDFILSDDDTQFIEIASTLAMAENDGVLKKFDENDLQTKPLSQTEQDRVIRHSTESKAYYNEINKVANLKNKGKSVGAYLTRLANELKAGGENGGNDGTDLVAGTDAYDGINNFYDILQTLTEEEKQYVFQCSASNLTVAKNFQTIWFRLLSRAALDGKITMPESELADILKYLLLPENITDQQPCVELIAGNIEQILDANKRLFDICPEAPAKKSMASLEKKREAAKQKLLAANADMNSAVTAPPAKFSPAHYRNSSSSILKRLLSQLTIEEATTSDNTMTDGYQFKQIISSEILSTDEYAKLLHFFGAAQLQNIIRNKFEFADLVVTFTTEQNHLLINLLGSTYFQKVIPTSYELQIILNKFSALSTNKWNDLLPLLKMECMQPILAELLAKELEELPAAAISKLVTTLGVRHIATLLLATPPENFIKTLSAFSIQHQKEIRAEYLLSLTKEMASICKEREKKPTYLGIFTRRIKKTNAAHALKDVMENKADEKTLNLYEKQLERKNDIGTMHRRWKSTRCN